MAFPTAYLGFRNFLFRLLAISIDLHPAQERGRKWSPNFGTQLHELTGIRSRDLRHRARFAQVARPFLPGSFEQAALLHVATAEIITKKNEGIQYQQEFSCVNYRFN